MKNRYIAFDIDGTIFSSENILYDAYKIAIDAYNKLGKFTLELPEEKAIFNLIGKPSKEIYKELFPCLDEDGVDFFAEKIRTNLVDLIYAGKGIYYGNIVEVIKEIASLGYIVLPASNGSLEYVSAVIKFVKLQEIFNLDKIVVINKKIGINTKGDILAQYQQKYNFDSKDCIMIGDRTSDIDAAKFINCSFIGTMYGHGEFEEIREANEIVYSTEDLLGAIDKIYGK